MTVAVAVGIGFVFGVLSTLVALIAYSKFMDEHPPLASRWVIRGKEVEVYEIVHGRVYVYENGFPNHYALRYFMAAAKPAPAEEKP